MSQLFGFQINRKEGQKGQSPVPPSAEEPIAVAAGGYYGTYVDTDNQARNEFEMIRRYRDMACLLYTSPSPRDQRGSRMPSSA